MPCAENQDVEPLDDQADNCDDAVYACNDTYQDPVGDTDEQFKTAGLALEREKLRGGRVVPSVMIYQMLSLRPGLIN